jgi:hypothetical protein
MDKFSTHKITVFFFLEDFLFPHQHLVFLGTILVPDFNGPPSSYHRPEWRKLMHVKIYIDFLRPLSHEPDYKGISPCKHHTMWILLFPCNLFDSLWAFCLFFNEENNRQLSQDIIFCVLCSFFSGFTLYTRPIDKRKVY